MLVDQIIIWIQAKLQPCVFNVWQVAQHLANTYGDKAIMVAKLSNLTGKCWPVVGRRLHEEFPYIEGEVSLFLLFVLYVDMGIFV